MSYIGKQPDVVAVPGNSSITNAQVAVNAAIEATKLSFTQSGTGAVAQTVESKLKDTVSVKDFGAVGDGVTDDTAAFLNAIARASALGGGTIFVPWGQYKISSTLDITTPCIVLRGCGGDGAHDAGTGVDAPTKLLWYGAAGGTVVKVRTPANVNGMKITGSGLEDLEIDCRTLAGIGVLVESVNKCIFRRVHIHLPTIAAVKLTNLEKFVSLAEAPDTQLNLFEGITWRCIDPGSRDAHGMWLTAYALDPAANANVSLNVFVNCGGQNWSTTGSGEGVSWLIEEGDNNTFIRCNGLRIGSMPVLEIRGWHNTDSNHFINCSMGGGTGNIRIKGIASGYPRNPIRNSFYAMDNGNGSQYPVMDSGCRCSYHSDLGIWEKLRTTRTVIGEGPVEVNDELANVTNESLRIVNGSANHIILTNLTDIWGINIDGANLRFNTSGAGIVSTPKISAHNLNVSTNAVPANGVYLPSADVLGLSANGTERLRLSSAGITTDSSIGINTTAPISKLDVTQTANITAVQITSIEKTNNVTGAISGGEFIGSRGDGNNSFFGRLGLGFRRNDGTEIQSGVRVGGIAFGGQYGTGTTYDSASFGYAASIVGVSEGVYTDASTMPTAIAFRTGSIGNDLRSSNNAYGTERFRVKNSGQVRFVPQTTPASAEAGDVYYDMGTNKLRCYDGSTWNDLF